MKTSEYDEDRQPASAQKTQAYCIGEREPSIPFMQRPTCTIKEASKAVGLGRTKLYQLIKSGQIKSISVGRRRLIHVGALLGYLGLGNPQSPGF